MQAMESLFFIAEILRVILKSHSGIITILNCISLVSWLTASSKVIYFYKRVAVHPKRKGVKVGTLCQKAGPGGLWTDCSDTFAAEREELEEIS